MKKNNKDKTVFKIVNIEKSKDKDLALKIDKTRTFIRLITYSIGISLGAYIALYPHIGNEAKEMLNTTFKWISGLIGAKISFLSANLFKMSLDELKPDKTAFEIINVEKETNVKSIKAKKVAKIFFDISMLLASSLGGIYLTTSIFNNPNAKDNATLLYKLISGVTGLVLFYSSSSELFKKTILDTESAEFTIDNDPESIVVKKTKKKED